MKEAVVGWWWLLVVDGCFKPFNHKDTKAPRNTLDNGGGLSLIVRGVIIGFCEAFDGKR